MKKIIFFIPLLFILSFSSIISLILFQRINNEPSINQLNSVLVGKLFPKTTLSSLLSEEKFILDYELDKPFMVNFFSSWCVPCQAEAEILNELSELIQIFGISYKDKKQDTIKFINIFGNPFKEIGVDYNGMSAINWGVYGVPETFLINSQGKVELRYAGPITSEVLKKIIMPKLKEIGL